MKRFLRRVYHRLAARFEPQWVAAAEPIARRGLEPEKINERLRACLNPSSDGKELACVVIGFKNQPGLVEAVQSVLAQDAPVEIVVVNSGGGDPGADLRRRGIQVDVVNLPEPRYVGSARNLGIAATRAPYVSFLAADCIAEPGWTRGRLRRHQAGALAVSSAITNACPRNFFAWTSYMFAHRQRMPGTPAHLRTHFGISYARTLFEYFGTFREDLPAGEDTEFNERFSGIVPVAWGDGVRTAHRHPTSLFALLADEFSRGRRAANVVEELSGIPHAKILAGYAFTRLLDCWRLSWMATPPRDRRYLFGAAPFLAPGALAYSLGAALTYRGRTPRKPRVLALLQFRDEMRYLPGYFENVAAQVDGIIALDDGSDDGSTEFVAGQPSVWELVRKPGTESRAWNEAENRRLLIEAALRHQADWLIAVDADERLERDFRARAEAEIARAKRKGHQAYAVKLRELWNRPDTYRVDGIWGKKRRARFFRARQDHELDRQELHGQWAPLNSSANGVFPEADLIIYHLRMIRECDRKARQARYLQLDPERRWQPIGYEYLTDERGLRVKRVGRGRGYD